MVRLFSVIRLSRFFTLLLIAALVASAGCRILSPRSSPPPAPPLVPPSPFPPVVNVPSLSPSTLEQDSHSAFRPIIPEQFMLPTPVPVSVPVEPVSPAPFDENSNEPPLFESSLFEPPPDTADLSKIEELKQKISELEAQVAEARQSSSVIVAVADDQTEFDALPARRREVAEVKRLPIINRQGVTVYSDELHRVRIAVMDKSLFMPNTWQLSAEGEETLRTIAAEIRAYNPNVDVDIEGHTDSLMSDPNNRMQKHDISSTKANTVMGFFVTTLQWDVAQMGASSYGRSRPIADNGTPEGRARNNRVEIVLRSRSE